MSASIANWLPKILQYVSLAISLAPQAIEMAKKVKEIFSEMFKQGIITKAQQDALDANVDSIVALKASGITPGHWVVEPDPSSATANVTVNTVPVVPPPA